METRESLQTKMKESCITSLDSTNKAVVQASVGLGKTRLCLETLAHYNPDKITWLTNSEELRDIDTPNEFIKWGYEYLLAKTNILCYQSACKLEGVDLGFVIADEFDFGISEQYIKGIINNNFDKFLGVSGTYTEDKLRMLEELDLPLVYSISTNEVQDLEILNKTKVIFVEFELDTDKTRKIQTKDKSWMSSENEQYCYIEGQFIYNIIQLEALKKQANTHFNVARIPGFNYDEFKKKKSAISMKLKWIASQRAKILHTLDSSKRIARRISNRVLQNPNNKVLIFSTLTEHLDSFVKHTVHSKNKKDNTVFEDFNSGLIREAGCISVADRGKNFVGLNIGLFESYDGSSTKGLQRLGRFCRLLEGDSTIYVLVPYYWNKQGKRLPTRAAGWSLSMFANYILDDSNSQTIHLNDLIL